MGHLTFDHPEDAERIIRELLNTNQQLQLTNEKLEATNEQLSQTVTKLQSQVAWLTRQMFGRKSERWAQDHQPTLFGPPETPEAPQFSASASTPAPVDEPGANDSGNSRRRRGKRQPIPDHLPRVERIHDLPEEQKAGPPALRRIGEEVSEQLALEPGRIYVIRHVRYKYARVEQTIEENPAVPNMILADKPIEGLPKCLAAPSLLAHIAVSKFGDHLPLYRQEGILKRSGVELKRSSMCRWMQEVAAMCQPLLMLMKDRLLLSHVIQADETPVKQQAPGGGRGGTRTCYFYSYLGDEDHPYVLYDYQTDRSRAGPQSFFTDEQGEVNYHGNLQCDGYAGYGDLFNPDQLWGMPHIGCWAHVRRKFYDARTTFVAPCHHALAQIKQLYAIEREAEALEPDPRQVMRDEKSRPIVEALLTWAEDEQRDALPKSGLGEALTYLLNQATALTRYLDDGRLAIDNNACERSLRGIAIGRRNWMFTGSRAGGQAAAAMFSLISSAKRHEVEPLAYLTDVFTRLPATPLSQIDQFLPDLWQPPRS